MSVLVEDPTRAPISNAGIYVGDIQFDDALEAHVTGGGAAPAPNWFTDEAGRFEREFTVAGPGNHDFWMTVTKDGFEPALESVWSGDGAPDDPVRVRVTLRPTP